MSYDIKILHTSNFYLEFRKNFGVNVIVSKLLIIQYFFTNVVQKIDNDIIIFENDVIIQIEKSSVETPMFDGYVYYAL